MRDTALFLNGVFASVLEEILEVQEHDPERVLYMQPYSKQRIVLLAEAPPGPEDPILLLVSTTQDLPNVHYVGEIVGWEDKRELTQARLAEINAAIDTLQPKEGGVYGLGQPGEGDLVNLMHVRRLKRLSSPFSVALLKNVKTGEPLATTRMRAGGWQYVRNPSDGWLRLFL